MMADAGKSGTHEMEKDEELQGFIDLWKRMFGFMDSLGLRWAVELEIPDIIAKHGLQSMLSAEEIASYLPSPSPNMDFLSRILSFLAMRGIFTQTLLPNTQLIKYGLTPISKWLVKTRSSEGEGLQGCSMNPMVLMQTHEAVIAPWYRMGDCTVSASATFPFELVHGKLLFSFAKENPEFGRVFNNAMASHSKQLMKDILEAYGDGFSKLSFMSLVDVGGGDGSTISNIALAFPDIKCFNFDLPQVIREAPTYAGVQHIAGDMFLSVPQSDAILMKLILHDWGDEECVKLLKNCRGAIPKQGKLILVDVVLLDPGERKKKLSGFEEIGVMMDMVMLAHQRGKERREGQWKQLLQASGFNRYRIIHLPSQMSIIEAFPQ